MIRHDYKEKVGQPLRYGKSTKLKRMGVSSMTC